MGDAESQAPRRRTVAARSFGQWIEDRFDGWHFSTRSGTTARTAIAVVPARGKSNAQRAIDTAVAASSAHDVTHDQHPYARYLAALHNRGTTLQSRANTMVLTRRPMVLVQGAEAGHIATLCALEGWVAGTAALGLVEAYVMSKLSARLPASSTRTRATERTVHAYASEGCPAVRASRTVKQLMDALVGEGSMPNVQVFVAAVHAGAIIHTGFSDAGSTFRDRTARGEAGRHFSEAMDSILHTPMAPTRG